MKMKTREQLKGRMDTRNLTIAAMLTALSIILPMSPLRINLPPFTATVASHVPAILSMFFNPYVCLATSIGAAIGFSFSTGLWVVVVRAFSHIFFASIGCFMIKKKVNIWVVFFVTMLIHGISEVIVALFFGNAFMIIWKTVGVFTMIHHAIDFVISMVVLKALKTAKVM